MAQSKVKASKTAKYTEPLSALKEEDQAKFLRDLVGSIDESERDPSEIERSIKAYFSLCFASTVSYGGSTLTYIKKLGKELKIDEWDEILAILDPPKIKNEPKLKAQKPAAAAPKPAAAAPKPAAVAVPAFVNTQDQDGFEEDAEQADAEAQHLVQLANEALAKSKAAKKLADEAAKIKLAQDKVKRREERKAAAEAAAAAANLAGKKRSGEAIKQPPAKETKTDGGTDWILDSANKKAYDFCRHHKLIKLSGSKTDICPAEIAEEAFDEKDAEGKGWDLTPAQIAKLVEYGFVQDIE